MAMAIRICILFFWLLAMPMLTGGIWSLQKNELNKGRSRIIYMWVSGQFLLWAVFWTLCVPCILLELDFSYVVYGYLFVSAVLALGGIFFSFRKIKEGERSGFRLLQGGKGEKGKYVFWILFAGLLLFQLIQAVRMTYGDGDDAYYVAVSSITENADIMYRKLAYTGGSTGLDIRHGLAPFPVWIAFLAKISGVRTVSVAHVAVPMILIPMTYMIFYLLGKKLFAGKEQRIPLFLVFTELLVIFGDTSFYTVENFMIARSRQGKAALGSIVIPMLFVLLYLLLSRLEDQKKCGAAYWGLLLCVMVTGCLCSTMGALLCCLLVAVAGVCGAVVYRSYRILLPLALCCIPCVLCAVLYALNG